MLKEFVLLTILFRVELFISTNPRRCESEFKMLTESASLPFGHSNIYIRSFKRVKNLVFTCLINACAISAPVLRHAKDYFRPPSVAEFPQGFLFFQLFAC